VALSLSPATQLVGTTYSAEWRRIFPQDRGLIPANLYVSSEESGGAFSISRNENHGFCYRVMHRRNPKETVVAIISSFFLDLGSFSINKKVGMSEDTPNFNIDPDGEMTPPAAFNYNGHQVEIVSPDTARLIGNYWQIKIDGVLRGDYLFSSARAAAEQAQKLIDRNED
jgi:hypothetical protein